MLYVEEKVFLPPRYMSIANAVQQLIYVEENIRKENIYDRSTMCVGLARVGGDDQLVISSTLGELATIDFGGPLHSLVIVGEMHELEREMLMEFHCSKIKDVKKFHGLLNLLKEVKSNTKKNQKNTNDVVQGTSFFCNECSTIK